MKLLNSIKTFGAALLGGGKTAADISGSTAAGALLAIAAEYTPPADGEDGDDGEDGAPGASVTAIALTVDSEGAVTGGTATLSTGGTVPITVTTE